MPVPVPIEAMVGALLVHAPPVTVLLNVIVCPTHTLEGPVMEPMEPLDTTAVARQPEGSR